MKCPKCGYLGFDERRSVPQLRVRVLARAEHRRPSCRSRPRAPSASDDPAFLERADVAGVRFRCLARWNRRRRAAHHRGRRRRARRSRSGARRRMFRGCGPTPAAGGHAGPRSRPDPATPSRAGVDRAVRARRRSRAIGARPSSERRATMPASSRRLAAVVIDCLDSDGHRRRRHLFHDADLRSRHREFGMLPKVPLVAFLLVQNVGYLVAFTAGGQTLGKMAVGIRIVTAESGDRARHRTRRQAHRCVARARDSGRPRPALGVSSATITAASTIDSPARASSAPRRDRAFRQPSFRSNLRPIALATAFGVGYVPMAPGTFGSAVGLLLWFLLPASPWAQAVAIALVVVVGTWSGGRRRAPFRPTRSRAGRDRRSRRDARHALPQSRRLGQRAHRVPPLSRRRHRQAVPGQPARTAARRPRHHGRRC